MNTSIETIYNRYVEMRQQGNTIDEAVAAIRPLLEAFDQAALARLSTLTQDWEMEHGHLHRRIVPDDADATPTSLRDLQNDAIYRLRTEEPTTQSLNLNIEVTCPGCRNKVMSVNGACPMCGYMLPLNVTGTYAFNTISAVTASGESYFGTDDVLELLIRGVTEPLEIHPINTAIVIGRSVADSALHPDVDLSPYKGETLGVSRMHATISRKGNLLMIADMNSKNFTLINNQRLYPHEVRVLNNGDVMRFGRLTATVRFSKLGK